MISKQCRHGKWAPGTADPKSKAAPSDPVGEWIKRADEHVLPAITGEDRLNPPLPTRQGHHLKRLLLEVVNSTLGVFNEAVGMIEYKFWLENPVQFLLFKNIFKEITFMVVCGVMLELKPFCRSNAEPQLVFQSSYLRLSIQGRIKDWIVGPVQDQREMNHSQIHEALL